MNEAECMIYAEQLMNGVLTDGCLCPALERCMEILPKGSELSEKIGIVLKKLVTGEGADEEHPVREALKGLENGNVYISILHDVVAIGEERGVETEASLLFLKEAWEFAPGSYRRNRRHLKNRCVAELKEELPGWMIGMAAYARIMDFQEVLRRSSGLTHGFFRKELMNLSRHVEHEDSAIICGNFLSELQIPEISMCLTVCRCICEGKDLDTGLILSACRRWKNEMISGTNNAADSGIRGIGKRKVVAVAMLAAAGILIMVIATGLADTKKEQRLREALSGAMSVTVGETPNVSETNQMLAVFMQNMLKCVDDDIDLTVRICEMDEKKKTMDIEAVGEYDLGFGRRRVSVRRRVAF